MSNEPTWPTRQEVAEAWRVRQPSAHTADVAIEMCRTAWLAANDDPAADLPGTVRISPEGEPYVLLYGTGGDYWRCITGVSPIRRSEEVVGWERGTPVEGTPAAKAAEL